MKIILLTLGKQKLVKFQKVKRFGFTTPSSMVLYFYQTLKVL